MVLEEFDAGLVLAVWEPTGEPRVDRVLDLLDQLGDDVHQHAAVFDEIHQGLRATLTDLDSATASTPGDKEAHGWLVAGSTPNWSGAGWPGRAIMPGS